MKIAPNELIQKCINQKVWVILKQDRQLSGRLKGYDQYFNMILEQVTEYTWQQGNRVQTSMDSVLLNGSGISMIVPAAEPVDYDPNQKTGKQLAQAQGESPQAITVLKLADLKCSILHQLSPLRNLAVLVLQSSCKIQKVTLLNLPALKSFTAQSGLRQLLIKQCESLRVVNVGKNELERLRIEKCKQLKSLICNDNSLERIEDLPGSLQTVILSKNRIASLEFIPVLSRCRKLSLSNNVLTSLTGIAHFKLLRELRLNSNQLLELPQEMNLLHKLQLLDIGNNAISNIHPALSLRVSSLNIANNNVDAKQFLRHFTQVKTLNSRKVSEPVEQPETIPDYSQALQRRQEEVTCVKRVRVVSESRGLSAKVLQKRLLKRH